MRFKTMGIAVAMLFSLCFVINIHAASITSMSIYPGTDWGSEATVSVSLTADEGISFIDWYINDTYRFSSSHNGEKNVSVSLGTFNGNIKGKKYRVRGVVSFVESSDEDASDTFKVYKPVFRSSTGSNTGAGGYSEVGSLTFDGSSIVMSGYASVYNGTNETLQVAAWFRQQKYHTVGDAAGGLDGLPRRDPPINDPIVFVDLPPNQTFSDSVDSSKTEFRLDRKIGPEEILFYDAHTHLQVTGQIKGKHKEDHWESDSGVQRFTEDDNPD